MGLSIIPLDLTNFTEGEQRIANKIKSLYTGIARDCFLYVRPRLRSLEPDFILIDPSRGICILEIKDWSINFIQKIDKFWVTTTYNQRTYNPVNRANQYFNFAKSLFDMDRRLVNDDGDYSYKLFSIVIFTNLLAKESSTFFNVLDQYPTTCIFSDQIRALTISDFFGSESCYINSTQLLVIRSILFPEIKICDIQSDSCDENKNEGINNVIKVLDSEQEQFAKKIPNGHYMVTGVPGSGKTVILLSRAVFLLKENPDWKIQIVTYNRSLKNKIQNRLDLLAEDLRFSGLDPHNISIDTFHKLATQIACVPMPLSLTDEFWNHELPTKAFERATPRFDAMLIDEYQDFYDEWIKVCIKLCKKHDVEGKQIENIFLAGDRLQSIYNPKEHTWNSIGINIVGRSKLFKHTYRAGKAHIELALKLLLSDKKLKSEVSKFYEGKEDIKNQTDIAGEIKFIEGDYRIIESLLSDLISYQGYKPQEILILAPRKDLSHDFYNSLSEKLKQRSKVTKDACEKNINIMTYHSAKGIENKICILLNAEEVDDLKLMYVGITRASEKLYIHSSNFKNSSIASKLRFDGFVEAEE